MKPIGYWLNRTDKALTHYMNGVLTEFGLTRIDWQILNVIQDNSDVTDTEVLSALAANADTAKLTAAIDTVLTHDWVTRPAPGRLTVSPEGARHIAHVANRVDAFRELSTAGISPDEYRTAVSVLERMTRNLETPSSTDLHRDTPMSEPGQHFPKVPSRSRTS